MYIIAGEKRFLKEIELDSRGKPVAVIWVTDKAEAGKFDVDTATDKIKQYALWVKSLQKTNINDYISYHTEDGLTLHEV